MNEIPPGRNQRPEIPTSVRRRREATEAFPVLAPAYFAAMQDRERTVSTFMGNGLAIPHGTNDAKDAVLGSALTFVRYDGGVDWDGQRATFVVGIAGKGGEHLEILSQIAILFSDDTEVERLRAAPTPDALFTLVVDAGAA